jgi:hypothetical protein
LDILEILRNQLNLLPEGLHILGLRSVLRHVEVAHLHYARGQTGDESAFTDAIYRTNQAFEGSIKEAYRVLASKDPQDTTPYEIESYLLKHQVFRERVLSQFTNYRTQWRNPSTHDYSLDFDEDEAFLAIVSVSAFAKLLIDEIAERLSFVAVKKDVEQQPSLPRANPNPSKPLVERIINILQDFIGHYSASNAVVPIETEGQLLGALAGFLSSIAPDLQYQVQRVFRGPSYTHYVDLVISNNGGDQVLVEVKRGQYQRLLEAGVQQLEVYMSATGAKAGVLFLYLANAVEYEVIERKGSEEGRHIFILRPDGA